MSQITLIFRKKKLNNFLENHLQNNKKTLSGVVDENITGHFWTGRNADTLLLRCQQNFKDAKIVIIVRNQFSMLNSLYFNYIKNGGCLSFDKLRQDICFEGHLISTKLCYYNLISKYFETFGKKNVHVFPFEKFCLHPKAAVQELSKFLGCKKINNRHFEKKINIQGSVYGLRILQLLNILNLNQKTFTSCVLKIFKGKRKVCCHPPKEWIEMWKESNHKLINKCDINLERYLYPLNQR